MQRMELDKESLCAAWYNALDEWAKQIQIIQFVVINKMS